MDAARNSVQLIYADDTSLNAWRRDDLTSAVAILSQETQDAGYHRLANLALVKARLEQWEPAERAARASIEIQPTIVAYIATSIALGGQGQLAAAKQEFNQAFLCHEPKNTCLLLLIKSIIIFVAGDRNEATRRVGDLVQACEQADQPLCRAVQAQMQFLVGQTALDEKDSEEALNLFASAGASTPFLKLPELDTITLIFGWDFDSLLLGIRQRTCEALYMASRMSEATQSLQALSNEFGAEIRASVKLNDWYQNFSRKCAKASQDTPIDNSKHAKSSVSDSGSLFPDPTPSSIKNSVPQSTLNPFFYLSTIDISLARDSRNTIESVSIKLRQNDGSLRNIQKTVSIDAGGVHQEEFEPPLALDPNDVISVSVSCSQPSAWKRVSDISIDIDPRDVECMRDDQGIRSYRKKKSDVEVLLNSYQPLHVTTSSIIESCERFRLLVIGDTGVGKSSLIEKVFGVEGIHTSGFSRGIADIDQEFISPTNARFVVHYSLGFEPGDERNIEIVKEFIARRKAMPRLKDQLHAIWLCLETPYAGGRLLEIGVTDFLERRRQILGEIPLVVVLTKVDLLDIQLELDLPTNEDVMEYKSRYLNEHYIEPLRAAAGSNITCVAVSVRDGYSESLSQLVKAMHENMAKYHVHETPQVAIAQRVSIKEKIELSIAIAKKHYQSMLRKSTVFRDRSLQECLQTIYLDVIAVWNFNDPNRCLMDDSVIGALLRTNIYGNIAESSSNIKKDVKTFIAYIVDLICLMRAIFFLTPGDQVTADKVALALQAYEQPRKVVHLRVDAFDGKLSGGSNDVFDKIEELIWRYSIADHEMEELRRKVLPSPGFW